MNEEIKSPLDALMAFVKSGDVGMLELARTLRMSVDYPPESAGLGRDIVRAIQAYERRNGTSWRVGQ